MNTNNNIDSSQYPQNSTPQQLPGYQQPSTEPQFANTNEQPEIQTVQPIYTTPSSDNGYFTIGGAVNSSESQPIQSKPSMTWTERWSKIQEFLLKRWWLVLLVATSIVAIFIATFAYFVLNGNQTPVGEFSSVSVRLEAPDTLAKGSPGDWKITIENRENTALNNVQVELNFDRSFEFSRAISPSPDRNTGDRYTIARLDPAGQGIFQAVIQFQGITKGNIDEEILMQGQVSYTPEALIRAEAQGRLPQGVSTRKTIPLTPTKTRTTAARINILMNATNESVPNNSQAEFTIKFQNTSEREIRDLRILMNYPQGFTYTSSELRQDNFSAAKNNPDDGNNIWNVQSLQRLAEQTLVFRGNVTGENNVKLAFRVDMQLKNEDNWQTIATTTRDVTITARPLSLSAIIDGKGENSFIEAGETLNFTVNYENQGVNALRNVEVSASVQDPANILDWSSLRFNNADGSGNIDNRTVRWSGSNIPQLNTLGVSVKGSLRFSIKTKPKGEFLRTTIPQNQYFLIPQIRGQAQGLQAIEASGQTYKAKGDLQFTQDVQLQPADTAQTNRRRYKVTWNLRTEQNQVNQVIVKTRSSLPTRSFDSLFASIVPDSRKNDLTFNQGSGELIWRVGNVQPYAGISNPVATISFDIIVEINVDTGIAANSLYEAVTITGTDDYTGEQYTRQGSEGRLRN